MSRAVGFVPGREEFAQLPPFEDIVQQNVTDANKFNGEVRGRNFRALCIAALGVGLIVTGAFCMPGSGFLLIFFGFAAILMSMFSLLIDGRSGDAIANMARITFHIQRIIPNPNTTVRQQCANVEGGFPAARVGLNDFCVKFSAAVDGYTSRSNRTACEEDIRGEWTQEKAFLEYRSCGIPRSTWMRQYGEDVRIAAGRRMEVMQKDGVKLQHAVARVNALNNLNGDENARDVMAAIVVVFFILALLAERPNLLRRIRTGMRHGGNVTAELVGRFLPQIEAVISQFGADVNELKQIEVPMSAFGTFGDLKTPPHGYDFGDELEPDDINAPLLL
ncbi:MAG: hypothetical protein LBB38_00175 [Puniceicoccales bacterium]|nr:hypothetical protein [Puniceicoccales bacterium]